MALLFSRATAILLKTDRPMTVNFDSIRDLPGYCPELELVLTDEEQDDLFRFTNTDVPLEDITPVHGGEVKVSPTPKYK